jgi:peroxiredoxin family protein
MTEAEKGRLSLIVFSGDYDRVHYALAMAAASVATARPVTLLFTMGAVRALAGPDSDGIPGWAALSPSNNGQDPASRDAAHAASGVATLEEMFDACAELGAIFQVCEMGMTAEDIAHEDLRMDLNIAPGGLVGFLAEAERDGGQVVFI